MFMMGLSGDDPEYKSWQFPTVSNPFIDPAEIEALRATTPEAVFRREYLAEFVGDAGARIKREWLQYVEPNELPGNLEVVMGVDLAISEKTTADYTAVVTVGYHRSTGKIYVLDVWRGRCDFPTQVDTVLSIAAKYKPAAIGVEDVGYQRAFAQALSSRCRYAVRAIKHTKDKITRLAPVEARYSQKLVSHVRGLSFDFERELLAFPDSAHDDMVDALSTAWDAIFASGLVVPVVRPLGGVGEAKLTEAKPKYVGMNKSISFKLGGDHG
jgi:predicted phage terminase large subunit-like protein